MKLMKSKIATALVLTALSFGMFSFTTTPISAQETNSAVVYNEDLEAAGIKYAVARKLAGFVVFAVAAAVDAVFGSVEEARNYPQDSLD